MFKIFSCEIHAGATKQIFNFKFEIYKIGMI